MDFSIIERAGITQQQFGKLVGVSRITVNTWARGKYKPRPDIRARVAKACKVLTAAVDAGHLPVIPLAHTARVETHLADIFKQATTVEG